MDQEFFFVCVWKKYLQYLVLFMLLYVLWFFCFNRKTCAILIMQNISKEENSVQKVIP